MLELARDDREQPYRGCASMWRAAVRQERLALEHEQTVADVPRVPRPEQLVTRHRFEVADAAALPWPDSSVDLSVTSPPYALGVNYPGTFPTMRPGSPS